MMREFFSFHRFIAARRWVRDQPARAWVLWGLGAMMLRLPFLFVGEAGAMVHPALEATWLVHGAPLWLQRLFVAGLVAVTAALTCKSLSEAGDRVAGLWAGVWVLVFFSCFPGSQSVRPEILAALMVAFFLWVWLPQGRSLMLQLISMVILLGAAWIATGDKPVNAWPLRWWLLKPPPQVWLMGLAALYFVTVAPLGWGWRAYRVTSVLLAGSAVFMILALSSASMMVIIPVLAVAAGAALRRQVGQMRALVACVVLVGMVQALVPVAGQYQRMLMTLAGAAHGGFFDDRATLLAEQMKRFSSPGDHVLVCGETMLPVQMAGLTAIMPGGWAWPDEVRAAKPLYVLIRKAVADGCTQMVGDWIDRHYVAVAEFDGTMLLARRGRIIGSPDA